MASSQNGEYGQRAYNAVNIERRLELALNENEAARIRRTLNKRKSSLPDIDSKPTKVDSQYLDPDRLFVGERFTSRYCIIFTPAGTAYYESGNVTHMNLMRDPHYSDIFKEFGVDPTQHKYDWFVRDQDELLSRGLFGRAATNTDDGKQYLSFWNTPASAFQRLIKPCLEQLIKYRVITPETLVHHPSMIGVPVGEIVGGTAKAERNVEAEKHADLARQVHLMRGDEKKAAMKKLGVGGGGVEPKITQALKKANLLNPGQKWWAQTSESVDRGQE